MADDTNDTPTDEAGDALDESAAEVADDAARAELDAELVEATDDSTPSVDDPEPTDEGDGATKGAGASAKGADKADRKAKADAVIAQRTVQRRTVTSRRVTPKGGAKAEPTSTGSKARDAKKTESAVARPTVAPNQVYAKGPSPWWVPAIMWTLLVIGALIIITNYTFGDEASNMRLVLGLGFILGGIIAATQYR